MTAKELKQELEYKNKSAFDAISEDELERSFAYAESYKLFLDCGTFFFFVFFRYTLLFLNNILGTSALLFILNTVLDILIFKQYTKELY